MLENSENKPLQIYLPPPQTRNAKNPTLNNPSEYKPHCYLCDDRINCFVFWYKPPGVFSEFYGKSTANGKRQIQVDNFSNKKIDS